MTTERELSTVLHRVEQILATYPETRNSDRLLLAIYMKVHHNINSLAVYATMSGVPSFESIRRSRQKIQQQGRWAADEKIKDMRFENTLSYYQLFR